MFAERESLQQYYSFKALPEVVQTLHRVQALSFRLFSISPSSPITTPEHNRGSAAEWCHSATGLVSAKFRFNIRLPIPHRQQSPNITALAMDGQSDASLTNSAGE